METQNNIESYLEALLPEVAAKFCDVSKRYGSVLALNNVSFRVHAGELVALLGANGAGKTTAVKLLLGLAQPNLGKAEIFGEDPRDAGAKMRVGAMLQVGRVPETLKVREHIELFSSYYPRPLPMRTVIETAGLQGLEDRLFGKLSGGQRQRVLFALAICGDPDLLFLDEPTVGLDVDSRRAFWQQIRTLVQRGRGVLLTTHYLEEADALADRIVVLNRGAIIAEGTPAEIKTSVAGKTIRCTTRLSVADVKAIPGVNRVQTRKGGLEILTSRAESIARELLARDGQLADIEIINTGLEEAFLEITKRDGANDQQAMKMHEVAL